MKPRPLLLLFALVCAPLLAAQSPAPLPANEKGDSPAQPPLTAAQLDALLAPIALYPDPLLAILLPATTFPADIVLAARFVAAGGRPKTFDAQPWDDSVKALARHPEILQWLDQNLDWTRRVGAAFALQPAEVLASAQRLRAAAHAAGNLDTTPQQTVLVEREVIRVLPARRDILYVPVYDYHRVYRHRASIIRYSHAYHTGPWLASHYCDWGQRTIIVVDRPHRASVWQHHTHWVAPRHGASRRAWHAHSAPTATTDPVHRATTRLPPATTTLPPAVTTPGRATTTSPDTIVVNPPSRRIQEATTPPATATAPTFNSRPVPQQNPRTFTPRRDTTAPATTAPSQTAPATPRAIAPAIRQPATPTTSPVTPGASRGGGAFDSATMPAPGTATETEGANSRRGR